MKAIETRDALLSSNVGEDGLKISDMWYKECLNELDQLEADAELGCAVRKAFVYFSMGQPEGEKDEIVFHILNEEDLLEWVKGVE
jgi:hypothetical protein